MNELDWHSYSQESDRKYRAVLRGDAYDRLADHNIINGCDSELRFVFDCARLFIHAIKGTSALDVCCGAGTMSDAIQRLGFNVVGLELNADAVALARSRFPHCRFVVGDAAKPEEFLDGELFDFILIREAHPFSRIDNPDFQEKLIRKYISLLRPGGVIVIGHARRGGGLHFPSINFDELRRRLRPDSILVTHPISFFLMKHIGIQPRSRILTAGLSYMTKVFQTLFQTRWIEFVIIGRTAGS